MKNKTAKHKLTSDMHKQIIESSKVLPPLVRLNPDGSEKTRVIVVPMKNGPKTVIQTIYVNHEVEMINEFWKGGEPAIKNYVENVISISKKNRKEIIGMEKIMKQNFRNYITNP